MATVPRVSSPSVAPAAAPNVTLGNNQSSQRYEGNAAALGQLGSAVGQAGNAVEALRFQATEQANALRVDDALNQATERALRLQHDPKDGYSNLKGYDALNRESGQPLADEYTGKLDAQLSEIAGTLGNPRQRAMFEARANNIRTNFLGGALQYENQQQKDYTLSVRESTVKNAADALVINAADPRNVEMQVARIRSSILGAQDPDSGVFVPGAAQMQGKSAAWGEEKAKEAISGAHTAAVQKFMEDGDLQGAMAYRKAYGQQMTGVDMLKVDSTLRKNYDTMQGAAVGDAIVKSTASAMQPTDMDRLRTIRDSLESKNGDFNPDGSLVRGPVTRSGERAMGGTQVMPSTAKDPGYGIKPADLSGTPQQQADELRRVGNQKLDVLVKMFDGDAVKAMAAYNWGEANVQKAVKEKGDDWLSAAPAETRNYAKQTAEALANPSIGRPTRPTLEQLQAAARERLGPNASPVAVKAAVDTVSTRFEAQTKAIAQRKDELVARGYQALEQAGGRWSDVPAGLRAKIQQDAPDEVDKLMNFGVRYSKGDDVTDDRLYLRLTNPAVLGSMGDAEFAKLRGGLSQSDFQRFAQQRADIKSGKTGDTAGDLNTTAVSRFADSRLRGLGIDPTPKDGSAEAQRVGAIRRFIDSSVLDAQRTSGKKFGDAEVQQHVDSLFAQNVQFRTTFLGISTGSSNRQLLSMKIGDVPSADADRIRKAFKAQGNDRPTEADVLGAYFAGQTTAAPRARGAQGSF